MAGFEISSIENVQLEAFDFDALKALFAAALKDYSTRVYSDEAAAKADKAELNKVKKIIEDKRKEYKNRCLVPYQAAEKQIKELVAMIDIEQERISASLDMFENDRKAKKEAEIRKLYDEKSAPLGEHADRLFRKIFNNSWLNATASRSKYEREMTVAIASAAEDLKQLGEIDTPYAGTLIELYTGGMTLAECMKKNDEYQGVNRAAGIQSESAPQSKSPQPSGDGVCLRLNCSQSQLEQVLDFMKAVGIGFEMIK